jgi:hypothetical protein
VPLHGNDPLAHEIRDRGVHWQSFLQVYQLSIASARSSTRGSGGAADRGPAARAPTRGARRAHRPRWYRTAPKRWSTMRTGRSAPPSRRSRPPSRCQDAHILRHEQTADLTSHFYPRNDGHDLLHHRTYRGFSGMHARHGGMISSATSASLRFKVVTSRVIASWTRVAHPWRTSTTIPTSCTRRRRGGFSRSSLDETRSLHEQARVRPSWPRRPRRPPPHETAIRRP